MENQNKNQLKSLKLLYVEDDEKTRQILEELLLRITDNLIVRTNGEEGLEAYKEHMPDIVISDIRMPIMNGLDMVKKIKEINKNAAIVFISAFKDPALVVKVVELDVKRFLFKPVRLKELKEILFSIAKDINAQREIVQKEIEIEQEKKLTEKILNTQNSIVLLTTKNDEIVKANNRFFEFFPFDSLDDFKKKHGCICKFFIKEDGLIKSHQDIQKIAEAGDKNQKNRAKIYDKNKNIVIFSIAAEKIMLDSKEHFVITLNDITTEEIAIEKAKELDKIKSEFFTNMSHEIRTPLNGIIGFADLLEENLGQNELKNYAHIISSSAKNLLSIIN
ncbi:MAG: hypothetical protein QG567_1698, partial [Campylobacterota bacterium]|nr:hypothetical protein [Campylobacterota bacterium]